MEHGGATSASNSRPTASTPGDRRIAELAAEQHGVVSRRQLLALGFSRSAIARRVAAGRLHPLHRGVYLVGHEVPPPRAHEMAAVLAYAPNAMTSHMSAMGIWGMAPAGRAWVEITVVRSRVRDRPGIRVHRTRSIDARRDVRWLARLPVTSPARTLLDVAPRVEPSELERFVADGMRRGIVRRSQLLELLERSPGRSGVYALRGALSYERGPAFTRSKAEQRFLDLVRRAGLPEPMANAKVEGIEVDFYWPVSGLVVEIDGYAYHSDRYAFERDRLRDAELQAAGLRVIRITWRQLTAQPDAVVETIAKALDAR